MKLIAQTLSQGDALVQTKVTGRESHRIVGMLQLSEFPEVELFNTKDIAAQGFRTRSGGDILTA